MDLLRQEIQFAEVPKSFVVVFFGEASEYISVGEWGVAKGVLEWLVRLSEKFLHILGVTWSVTSWCKYPETCQATFSPKGQFGEMLKITI